MTIHIEIAMEILNKNSSNTFPTRNNKIISHEVERKCTKFGEHINKVILFKQKNKCPSPRSSFYLFLQSKKINGKKKAIKKDTSKTTTL